MGPLESLGHKESGTAIPSSGDSSQQLNSDSSFFLSFSPQKEKSEALSRRVKGVFVGSSSMGGVGPLAAAATGPGYDFESGICCQPYKKLHGGQNAVLIYLVRPLLPIQRYVGVSKVPPQQRILRHPPFCTLSHRTRLLPTTLAGFFVSTSTTPVLQIS